MKSFIFSILFVSAPFFVSSQTYNTSINTLMATVNIDSLTKYVNDLSGENTVMINQNLSTITHRTDLMGNDLATNYIIETLLKTGLTVESDNYNALGKNVIAIQPGSTHPEIFYVISAHYDAIPNHAADDNASGTASVLEVARILSNYNFSYSIIYALWDQEEIGLIGSRDWAKDARDENVTINGIINLDMIGYNKTSNNRFDIYTGNYANSINLSQQITNFCSVYNLSLTPFVINSSTLSDQVAFWEKDYSAVLLIEPTEDGLFNPYYHTSLDRIDKFNMGFFHEMSKLGLGVIADLASIENVTSTEELDIQDSFRFTVYPNPVKDNGYIKLSLSEHSSIKIDILTITGITLKSITDEFLASGDHLFNIPDNLSAGVYLVRLQTDFGSQYKKLIILK